MPASASSERTWAGIYAGLIPYLISRSWHQRVDNVVPAPYLDEVFHIPQAQAYCAGKFGQWDPKITTPPGLYLISILISWFSSCCLTTCLRFHNTVLLCLVARTSRDVLPGVRGLASNSPSTRVNIWNDVHCAVNIALFPCLFFFSALYYTDIASALSVLLFYQAFLSRNKTAFSSIHQITLALVSLNMRQTNIFWVAIFPAGLALVSDAKASTPMSESRAQGVARYREILIEHSWRLGRLFDPQVEQAAVEDYLLMALSLAIISLRNYDRAIKTLAPYILTVVLFAVFVLWNGGVVLGDKSNHVATIHLPQMLYIWPYITYFSFPLMIPTGLRLCSSILTRFRGANVRPEEPLPRFVVLAAGTIMAILIVHFNTIVHPFTLADNRHYMFYIFRLLLRNSITKYGAAMVYVGCAWLSIQTLADPARDQVHVSGKKAVQQTRLRSTSSCHVSFVLVWLVASALSLVTAPLVEPRYFIIPWLLWRLNVPSCSSEPATQQPRSSTSAKQEGLVTLVLEGIKRHDSRLWLETAWSVVINSVTGYIFLYRGFAWPQEPGYVQRFMW